MSSFLATVLLGASFFTVQLHSVGEEQAALDSVRYLRSQGIDAYYLVEATEANRVQFKVRAGAFADREQARTAGLRIIKRLKQPEFFVAETQEAEVEQLALAMEPLIEDANLTSGFLREDARAKRVRAHAHNYLVVYLLASSGESARTLRHAAVWDTNLENHRELILVSHAPDGRETGYVLYWKDGLYEVARVATGSQVELYELWDLMPGPLRFVTFRVTSGGERYRRLDHVVLRWNTDSKRYDEVGRILTEREDHGVVPGQRHADYHATITLDDFDEDQELEVIAKEVSSRESGADAVRVYDWTGTILRPLAEPQEILDDWVANRRMSPRFAAEVLLGIARAHAGEGRLSEAEKAWRLIVLQLSTMPQAAEAKASIGTLADRRHDAQVRTQTAVDLAAAGSLQAAADELAHALESVPDHGPALYELARVNAALGRNFEALVYLERAFASDPDYVGSAAEDEVFATLRKRAEYRAVVSGATP